MSPNSRYRKASEVVTHQGGFLLCGTGQEEILQFGVICCTVKSHREGGLVVRGITIWSHRYFKRIAWETLNTIERFFVIKLPIEFNREMFYIIY